MTQVRGVDERAGQLAWTRFSAPTDSTTPSLWLSSIARTGQDTSAGGSSAAISLPATVFTGTPLSNRVNLNEGYPPITRQRLTKITTETGETISVNYSSPACGSSTPSDASQNTMLRYPDYWTPTGQTAPILDWFNKFIVSGVTEQDPTGGSANDTIDTTYTPVGAPAWHYNDDPTTPSNQRTWDQWRGYSGMIVSTGTAPDPTTETQYTYFRGMNGDTLPGGGMRSATVTDSRGDPAVTDSDQYAGMTYETVVHNGTAIVSDTISDPWSSAATATHALSGLPAQQAFHVGTADAKVYTPLASGTTQETETDYTHDSYGRVTKVNDQGDVSTMADDLCTTASYADNTTAWILDKPAEVATVSVNCATTPSLPTNAVSDALTFYDGSTTLGAAPTVGDATMTQKATSYTGSTPTYTTMSTATVDEYGRTLTATDADSRTVATTYTPATGAEPTSMSVKDPLTHITTTTFDPLRSLALSTTDAAGYVTTEQYDALGRLTAVYKPGDTPTDGTPATKYTYTVSNTGPSVVDTYTRNEDSTFRVTETLYDAMLRAREMQQQTPDNGRDVTDTIYNTDGWISETTDPYYNSGAVSTTYVQAQVGQVPSETGYTYDQVGRKTAAISYALGTETWRTTYTYGGNFVTTVPPAGATATTTLTNARGETTDLYSYHTGVPTDPVNDPASDYSDTHYTYYPSGQQASTVDAAGNTWSYQYDLLGNQKSVTDPDVGTTTNTYDFAGQLLTTTDARGKQTTYSYDTDGRKKAAYDTTGNAAPTTSNQTAAWTYDTALVGNGPAKAVGYPTSTTSYSGGDTYTQTVVAYNNLAKPSTVKTTLTGTDAGIIPTTGLTTSYGYTLTGLPKSQADAAVDGLPQETVGYGYDNFGEPTSVASTGGATNTFVQAVGYSEYGQPTEYTMPATTGYVWLKLSYDPQTHALTDTQTTDSASSTVVDDTSNGYTNGAVSKGAGLVVSTTDSQNGGATTDTQCFQYDYATRLSMAWTATDACSAIPAPGSSSTVGGPSPYWQSWTYDTAGDRLTQDDHDTSGNSANDTTTTYAYPASGSSAVQPHTLTSTSATGPNAAANTASYTYDTAGNTTSITGGSTGNQTLTWNDQDKLASDVTSSGSTSYVYDAGGNLLVRRDPGQTTLFFGDEQLVLNTATAATSGTRYYTIGGATIAARNSGGNPQYLIPDRQGTDQIVVDSNTQAVTRRQYLPFGQTRGTAAATWPGDKGYVGGTPDAATNLENLGAREYDPASGRFLSADPVFTQSDPTQMGGYDYAGNDPVTGSDPSGLLCIDVCGDAPPVSWLAAHPGQPFPGGWPPEGGGGGGGATGSTASAGPGGSSGGSVRHSHGGGKMAGEFPDAAPTAPVSIHLDWETALLWGGVVAGGIGLTLCGLASAGVCFAAAGAAAVDGAMWGGTAAAVSGGLAALAEGGGAAYAAAGAAAAAAGEAAKVLEGDASAVTQEGTAVAGAAAGAGSKADAAAAATGKADTAATAGGVTAPAAEPTSTPAATPSCNSFAGATPVLMADGSTKPIDQVRVGDTVTNAVPDSATVQKHVVTALHVTTTDREFDDLTVATADGPKTVTTTQHHLFWDATRRAWLEADQLRVGDELDTPGDGHVTVAASRLYTAAIVTYNLTIDNVHTYYVLAGTTPVLVHNCNNEATHDIGNVVANLDDNVYFHYTSEAGHAGILGKDGSLRIAANSAGKVHVTQEIGSPAEIEQNIFIGNSLYAGKADYVFSFGIPEGVELSPGSQSNELIARGSLKIPAENVFFHGRNPF